MAELEPLAVYCSHSWRPRDVELNAQVWRALSGACELLVDAPEELGANPPYHINRIEELLRRTDLFVCVLTHRSPRDGNARMAALECSPYSLFEIRLAERVDIPRLILYERKTRFRPPRVLRAHETYIPFERVADEGLPEQRQWSTVVLPKIQGWLEWVRAHYRSKSYEPSTSAQVLVSAEECPEVVDALEQCLNEHGYEPVRVRTETGNAHETLRGLHKAGLAICEFGLLNAHSRELYAAAHVIGVPTIRLRAASAAGKPLPWILRGEPGGYEEDIVSWSNPDELSALIGPRVASMSRLSPALRDCDAEAYFYSKRYAAFFVFLSHTLKPPHRALVEQVFELLKKRHVTPFEYHVVNAAGQDWKAELDRSLTKTTHFVALLSDDYELSPTCTYELDVMLGRSPPVAILPFMVSGRSKPNPRLNGMNMHHRLLGGDDVAGHAKTVAEQIFAALDESLRVAGA